MARGEVVVEHKISTAGLALEDAYVALKKMRSERSKRVMKRVDIALRSVHAAFKSFRDNFLYDDTTY